jgi:anti-sigma B factor antagonist
VPAHFSIESEAASPGAVVLKLVGELDLAVASELKATLEQTPPDQAVVVDLTGCEFIDSTGIAVLMQAMHRQQDGGGRLALCSPIDQVKRVLEVTGLTRDGLVFADREQALGS